ncbi:hypothetical protein QR98_0081530 [Sarcoptes scabiei]|uniref:Uncharacterized protein n=1 Tax=Sarcoptes scabiei TaxID=52283 RepID=A0A132AF51_SARSC|nr:hypothetical protein QR98_0081530 [Sarcoptes scabiei]
MNESFRTEQNFNNLSSSIPVYHSQLGRFVLRLQNSELMRKGNKTELNSKQAHIGLNEQSTEQIREH